MVSGPCAGLIRLDFGGGKSSLTARGAVANTWEGLVFSILPLPARGNRSTGAGETRRDSAEVGGWAPACLLLLAWPLIMAAGLPLLRGS